MTRKSTASSWLWWGNKYYYIYYDNIWQNVTYLKKITTTHSLYHNDINAPVISLWIRLWSNRSDPMVRSHWVCDLVSGRFDL